jgi:ribulose-phosphate 3-epimerase
VSAVRAMIDGRGRAIDLEIDGGINPDTARTAIAAGADVLVAGTASFAGGPSAYAGNIRQLRGAADARPGG